MLIISKDEANKIPILQVARLVVPKFIENGTKSTGQCNLHTDNVLGNLRFKTTYNYAHCFTCNHTWKPVDLVMSFTGRSFKEALEFLYERFTNYFSIVQEIEERPKWTGLSNKDYSYLGISIHQSFGNVNMDIRDFAIQFPKEHDDLLMLKILEKYEEIDKISDFLSDKIDPDKLKKDKENIEKKLIKLLNKGLMNKSRKREIFISTETS